MAWHPTHLSRKSLVLGASGFLGSWTVRAMHGENTPVVVLARPTSDLWRIDGIEGVEIKRAEPNRWADAIEQLHPTSIVSLEWAGVAGAAKNDARQWDNVPRQRALVDAALRAGVERYIGVGSQAEYGPHDGPIHEEADTAPRTVYGQAKLAARDELQATLAGRMSWAWGRVFSTFGPLDNPHWLLPGVIDRLGRGEEAPVSVATQPWSYLFGSDAGRAFAALAGARVDGVFNVGHPDAPVLRTFIEGVADRLGRTDLVRFGAVPLGPDAVRHLQPVTSRLESLGWHPEIALEDAIDQTARWFQGKRIADVLNPGASLPVRQEG